MNERTRRGFLWGCAAALAFSGCSRRLTASSHYEVLRDDGEPLRSAFNRAAGSVRIVVLVSPT
jgi:hypothetical protein